MSRHASSVAQFMRDAQFLATPDNIDSFPVAMGQVLNEIKLRPEILSVPLIETVDNVMRNLMIGVINASFNPQGVGVFLDGAVLADQLLPLMQDKALAEEYKWRWGAYFDTAKNYSAIIEERQRQEAVSMPDISRMGYYLQSWMKMDENGNLVTVNEHLQFYG